MNFDCDKVCSLKNRKWCDNLRLGLKTLYCPDDECVRKLCRVAQECEELATHTDLAETKTCPVVFDGWTCFNATKAGNTAVVQCPNFEHLNFQNKNLAFRHCASSGVWLDPELNRAYTHYDQCLDTDTFEWYNTINKIYVAGYSVSLLLLLLSILILVGFRSLHCARNSVHTHLFVASALHNALWIVWYFAVVYRMGGIAQWSEIELFLCKVLNTLINYFMVCTYFWMLCEGCYLFVVLLFPFVSESRVLFVLNLLGWLVPLMLIAAYTTSRTLSEDHRHHQYCWMEETWQSWIYKVPCISSILANLLFLGCIVRVLLAKLHDVAHDHMAIVKTAKAIGLLVPLFGLHNILAAFKPESESSWLRLCVELASALSISLQGSVVSILFCLINAEARTQLAKWCRRQRGFNSNQHRPSLAITMQSTVIRQSTPNPKRQSEQEL